MTFDDYFMNLTRATALRSKDRSTQVGCVIVDTAQTVRATGYNGFPRGINDDVEARHERPAKYKWTEHAERNAIYTAARVGVPLLGCTMYVSLFPCMDCARAIVQSGVGRIVCEEPDLTNPRWGEDFKLATELLGEAGVEVRYHK